MISNHVLLQFLIFRSQTDSDKGHEGDGVADGVGGKEVRQ